ncbi:MAG: AGE family epimerase/isomerase [Pirellulales bacterium]
MSTQAFINSHRGNVLGSRAADLLEQYRVALFDDVVPWWEKHSIDRECGGYYSCLERDGQVYAGDKFMWMVGREIWMFSHLYNQHEPREEWLEYARHGATFMLEHGFREDGKMHFRLSREGKPIANSLSLYTECFATIALAELGLAARDKVHVDRAVEMYERLRPRLGQPDDTALLGYPINAKFHLHAHDMIRLTVAWVLADADASERWQQDITLSVNSLLAKHWKPQLGVLLENVAPDGSPMLDLPEGRMVHPGHAIESSWMLMEVALQRSDRALLDTAVEIALKSLEFGWDAEYGGIRYLMNIDRTPTHPIEADMKLWWPHCEALYALLLAWVVTGRDDIGRWFDKLHRYTFDHFPDAEFGEWYGYLNRDGSPTWTAKANGWKGFFHLPRVLLRCYQLLLKESE